MHPNLNKALALAQSEMPLATATGFNPHFKSSFATLADLVIASRPTLTKYEISVIQYATTIKDETFVVTILGHSSGEERVSEVKLYLEKPNDMQAFGKACSYMFRYMYKGIVGIMTNDNDNEDDDGNTSGCADTISEKQLAFLKTKLINKPEIQEALIKGYGALSKVPWRKFNDIIKKIDEQA